MKGRILDTILIFIIAISGGFVGYRLMKKNSVSAPIIQKTSIAPTPIEAPPTYKSLARARPNYATGPFQSLLYTQAFTPTQWAEVKKMAPLDKYFVDATDACKNPIARTLHGYPILNKTVEAKLKSGSLEFLIELSGQICVRKNSVATIISIGDTDEEPVLSLHSDVTIEDIIQLPNNQIAIAASKLFSIPEAKLTEYIGPALRRSHGKMALLRISKPRPSQHDKSIPSQGFPRYNVVTSERLTAWLNANPGATVVDVRSNKERRQIPILYSGSLLTVPYSVHDRNENWNYRWDRTWLDLDKDAFDIAQVLRLADTGDVARPVLIVGAASTDGRPVWALLALFAANMGNVAWFYDGAAAFNHTLSNKK